MPGFECRSLAWNSSAELVPGPARARAKGAAALQHEALDDAMKDEAVKERPLALLAGLGIGELLRAFCKPDEIGYRVGNFLVEQLDFERAFARVEHRVCHLRLQPIIIAIK